MNNPRDTNDLYYPLDMDTYVLIPDRTAMNDIIVAHGRYDPPGEPLILSAITEIMDDF